MDANKFILRTLGENCDRIELSDTFFGIAITFFVAHPPFVVREGIQDGC